MKAYWWFPFLLTFQGVDLAQTSAIGIEREGNPFMVLVWGNLGWEAVVTIKALTVFVVIASCWFLTHPKNPIKWMHVAFHVEVIVVLVALLGVIIWNWTQLGGY